MAVKWNSSVKLIVFTLQHSTSSQISYWAGWFAFICFNGLYFSVLFIWFHFIWSYEKKNFVKILHFKKKVSLTFQNFIKKPFQLHTHHLKRNQKISSISEILSILSSRKTPSHLWFFSPRRQTVRVKKPLCLSNPKFYCISWTDFGYSVKIPH